MEVGMTPVLTRQHTHVMLPLATVAESDGTHVNCEGKNQSWKAAIHPKGESRPGWKILRVLANYLDLEGFDFYQIPGRMALSIAT